MSSELLFLAAINRALNQLGARVAQIGGSREQPPRSRQERPHHA